MHSLQERGPTLYLFRENLYFPACKGYYQQQLREYTEHGLAEMNVELL